MHISFQALVLVALSLEGALAQPAHRHQHKHRRDLADVLGQKLDLGKRQDFNDPSLYKDVDWKKVFTSSSADTPPPASTTAAAPPASTPASPPASSGTGTSSSSDTSSSGGGSDTSSSTGSGSGSCVYPAAVWDKSQKDTSQANIGGATCPGGCTSADGEKFSSFSALTQSKSDGKVDDYQGNVGQTYGHNMYPLSGCDVSGQQYSITFTNADTSKIEVALWNKVGDDYKSPGTLGPITGAFRNAFFKFPLEGGQSASFAVDKNSQVAFSQACDRSFSGGHDCTWGEADFGNESNKGYSGYDRSSIPNSKGNTGLLTVCADGHDCSSAQSHSFVSASQTDAGGNLAISPGEPMHLKVTMG